MSNYQNVSIIIQARSTSTRFPRKIYEKIGSKTILQHVLDRCNNSAQYINSMSGKHGTVCQVAIAVPYDDDLISEYRKNKIIQGPEDDVLSRYMIAARELESDYIVRITSDCPLIPPFIISKAIGWAVQDKMDFVTNADPLTRTSPDGHDVEVLSRRLLDWLDLNANDPMDREHVTCYLSRKQPDWAKIKPIIGFFKNHNKLSVDTPEDLEMVRKEYSDIYDSIRNNPGAYRL